MRDDEMQCGVFSDSEEYQHYRKMFTELTNIMAQIGFSEEVPMSIFTYVFTL